MNLENGEYKFASYSIHQSRSLVAHVSGTVPPLSDMTPTLLTVEPLGIAHVQGFKHLLQSHLGLWNCDKIDLIGHQALSENLNLEFRYVVSQPTQINKPTLVVKKYIFSSIALLDYIVRYVGAVGSGRGSLLERIITAGMQYRVAFLYHPAG